jgi:undecaprenyl-diphosphatase
MNSFDNTVYHAINGLAGHNVLLDDVMKFFAQYALEIYAMMFIMAWFSMPKREFEQRHGLILSGIAGIAALVINVIIAHIYPRSRPFTVLPHGDYTQLIPHAADSSFPSDHSSGSWAFAAGSWNRTPRWTQIVFTVVALVVMFARVYVGVHWPTDVLASVVVGIVAGRGIALASPAIRPLSKWLVRLFRFDAPAVASEVSEKQSL